MIKVDCEYQLKDVIGFIIEASGLNSLELSEKTKVSRTTLAEISRTGKAGDEVCEKIYSYAYKSRYRINIVKEELSKEKYGNVLFHGSKNGLKEITITGSRNRCDFGNGFYLGETYNQALSFVCENEKSSVYAFRYSLECLNIVRFDCSLEWMLAICYFRGTLGEYSNSDRIQRIANKVNEADVVIAPIADNKMFHIMAQFVEGDINADVALHSLSASRLGLQYIFKTDQALERLVPIEKYYLCASERKDCIRRQIERSYEIDTKLKLAKREFKTSLYIEELLDEKV